jgi:hypothetical protein
MATAMAAPMFWPNPAAIAAIPVGNSIRARQPSGRTVAFCSHKPPRLAPSDDQGYPVFLIVHSANRTKLGLGDSWVQEMSRTAFDGDNVTHGGQKGFGMTKHGRSGHATRSPRFRFLQKLEAQKDDRKDRSRIKDPKQSVEELFHPRKPT